MRDKLTPKLSNDMTDLNKINFWKRLETFISNIQVNDAMSEEEKDVILLIAKEQSNSNKEGVIRVPQFEELLQVRLEELPYTKHLDDGQYNDGQVYGFECGARWAYEKLSCDTAVSSEGREEANTCADNMLGLGYSNEQLEKIK